MVTAQRVARRSMVPLPSGVLLAGVMLLGALLFPATAWAQPAGDPLASSLEEASTAFDAGDWARAAAAAGAAIATDPGPRTAEVRLILAWSLDKLGDPAGAIDQLDRLIRLDVASRIRAIARAEYERIAGRPWTEGGSSRDVHPSKDARSSKDAPPRIPGHPRRCCGVGVALLAAGAGGTAIGFAVHGGAYAAGDTSRWNGAAFARHYAANRAGFGVAMGGLATLTAGLIVTLSQCRFGRTLAVSPAIGVGPEGASFGLRGRF